MHRACQNRGTEMLRRREAAASIVRNETDSASSHRARTSAKRSTSHAALVAMRGVPSGVLI